MNWETYRKLNALLSGSRRDIEAQFSSDFYESFEAWVFRRPGKDRLGRYRAHCESLFIQAQAKNKVVLDSGCGYGLMAILFSLLGAKEVTGVDINSEKMACFRKLVYPLGLDNVHIQLVSGAALGVPEATFDVVLSNEVVSHVAEPVAYLREMGRVLKPEGILMVRDGNNALNPAVLVQQRDVWERSERGPVQGTGLDRPYVEMRKGVLSGELPHLPEERLVALAQETQGLWGTELVEAAREFQQSGRIERRAMEFPYRNPITGEYQERPLDPYQLRDSLLALGFSWARVYPVLPIRGDRRLLWWLLRPFYGLLLRRYSQAFTLVARKGQWKLSPELPQGSQAELP